MPPPISIVHALFRVRILKNWRKGSRREHAICRTMKILFILGNLLVQKAKRHSRKYELG